MMIYHICIVFFVRLLSFLNCVVINVNVCDLYTFTDWLIGWLFVEALTAFGLVSYVSCVCFLCLRVCVFYFLLVFIEVFLSFSSQLPVNVKCSDLSKVFKCKMFIKSSLNNCFWLALQALEALNYTELNGNPIRIMWSHRDSSARKSGIGNLFVKVR